jgi:transcriptional regulator with XRE-family HTH domain
MSFHAGASMCAKRRITIIGWIGFLQIFAVGGMVFAQTEGAPSSTSGTGSLISSYLQDRVTLAQSRSELMAQQGVTEQQIENWEQANAPGIAELQQIAKAAAQASDFSPLPLLRSVGTADGDSSAVTDFLTSRTRLYNTRAQIYDQLLQELPSNPSRWDIAKMRIKVEQTFQQQEAASLQAQVQYVQALANAYRSQPIPTPPPVAIPANAASQLQAYLTQRSALAASRAQLLNQYLNADTATRSAAIQQWEAQNAPAIQQMNSQLLSSPTSQ